MAAITQMPMDVACRRGLSARLERRDYFETRRRPTAISTLASIDIHNSDTLARAASKARARAWSSAFRQRINISLHSAGTHDKARVWTCASQLAGISLEVPVEPTARPSPIKRHHFRNAPMSPRLSSRLTLLCKHNTTR